MLYKIGGRTLNETAGDPGSFLFYGVFRVQDLGVNNNLATVENTRVVVLRTLKKVRIPLMKR